MLRRIVICLLSCLLVISWTASRSAAQDEGAQVLEENTGVEEETEPTQEEEDTDVMTLPAGTPIKLVMLEQLYSQRNREGDEIVFALAEDVALMGRTYLVEGTPVIGRVTHTRPARSWGRSGNIDIEITSIMPLYSMPVPLSGESGGTGGSRTVQSVGTTVLLGISVVGLLAGGSVSGSGAVIESGTQLTVFSADDATIMGIPEDEMRQMVDDWFNERVISSFLYYTWDNKCNISEAMQSMGYSVEDGDISVEPMENYYYQIEVQLGDSQTAIFTFQPFQEPHAGKFITLEAHNDLAEAIIRTVLRS